MYELSKMTPRVEKMRAMYRDTVPYIDIERYRLVTEFYKANRNVRSVMKRALNFANLCDKIPVFIRDDELIVGSYTATYKASALYPEYSIAWLEQELRDGTISTREEDKYLVRDEDRDYILETIPFWDGECLCSLVNPYYPETYKAIANNGVETFGAKDCCPQPIGHFAPNYHVAVKKGFAAVKAEADAKIAEIEANAIHGSAGPYNFYRGVSIVCGAMIRLAKRYSAECAKMAEACPDPVRKAELQQISETMGWIMENPARNFREAIQAVWFYEMCVLMDANMHGTSLGRIDAVLGDFAEKDIADGVLTREEAQELVDLYCLKVAECNKAWGAQTAKSAPGYTSGQLITVGGTRNKHGDDGTNITTYMFLESVGRMKLHSPPMALRVHPKMPEDLWDCALEVNKAAGGVPSFYSDNLVIPALEKRGISPEDSWNYCLIGCVEPSIGGEEWCACGGDGVDSYTNFANILALALNNGKSYMKGPMSDTGTQLGPQTGYLYEMKDIEEVKKAYNTQMEYWVKWHATVTKIQEAVTRYEIPQPVVSATMTGCMESGKDVMDGGSKYNSTGMSGIGLGNVAESLNVINELCFKQHKCTTRELYDALINDWEGYEELRQMIIGDIPHYGNGDPEHDEFTRYVAESYADYVVTQETHRGHFAAGMYPVTMNVVFGMFTPATPDSRRSGDPLSDGISAVQGFDASGPTSALRSVTCFDHTKYSNGILLNMKFHPTAINSADGTGKLKNLLKTYFFGMGGMQMQMNIVSADTLRDAQAHPENYKDLVVRVAGFSAYFVEVYKASQDDLIRRTELNL